MASTAFQYVFDNATAISINKHPIIGQTIARDQTVRAVERNGTRVWRFDVKLPDGLAWSEARPYIELMERQDRYQAATISLNNSGYNSWFMNYQGDATTLTGWTASATNGSRTLTLTASPTMSSGYKFRSGDLIQLGTGKVYSVEQDVPYTSNTVNLSRTVLDTTGSYSLIIGPSCTFNVICTSFPQWTIFQRNQVMWSGSFSFQEF